MENRVIPIDQPIFQPIKEAVKITGLSEYYLRQNLKAGKIPHIKSGNKIFINIPRLLSELEEQTSNSPISL